MSDEDGSFYLPIYRKVKYTGENTVRPAFVIHFYLMPDVPSDRIKLMKKNERVALGIL